MRLKNMPVCYQHPSLRELREQVGRHQVARPIDARLATLRLQLGQAVPNGDVGADHHHNIRKPLIATAHNLVQDAPGCQHPHHGRLAGAGSHLAGVPQKACVPGLLAFVAGLIPRDRDSL